ncbi:YkgJ family cysteine cluster protein [Streptomyces sp. NPDC088775]|uniref:YkgJ family cysteine cluster protein n=1 Tax=Streptomyces sp. NPDC088775 TaxID=3365896 RepID=UPI0037FEFC2E
MGHDEQLSTLVRLANAAVREPDRAALEELYAGLPSLDCQGKCWSACGGEIPASPAEMEQARQVGFNLAGRNLGRSQNGRPLATACGALDTKTHRCRIYEARPMICRLWGAFPSLACPWGCEPEGGFLDDVEALRRMNSALWHGGSRDALEPEKFEKAVSSPRVVEALLEQLGQHRPVHDAAAIIPATFLVRQRPG